MTGRFAYPADLLGHEVVRVKTVLDAACLGGLGDDPDMSLFFPTAVSVSTLTFATILAMVKPLGRIRGGRTPGV
jgi:hypothetical protein